jgi:hypothetical protein
MPKVKTDHKDILGHIIDEDDVVAVSFGNNDIRVCKVKSTKGEKMIGVVPVRYDDLSYTQRQKMEIGISVQINKYPNSCIKIDNSDATMYILKNTKETNR